MSNGFDLVTPLVTSGSSRPPPAPVRRTYGKKRILDPELLDIRDTDMPFKKNRTSVNSGRATVIPNAKPQDHLMNPIVQTPLLAVPMNKPRRMDSSPPVPGPAPSRLSSPTKPAPRVRSGQDQNALDSPFLVPRRPSGSRPGAGLTRRASSRKTKPKSTYSRHLSHSTYSPKKRGEDDKKEALRRKTSEATTTVSVAMSGEHSWLVPAPPRALGLKTRYMSTGEPGEAEFSFNPPAESTLAVHARTPQGQPGFGPGRQIDPGSVTPRANPGGLMDMRPRRKRHDSILSTDSEDEGTTLSVTAVMPMVAGPHIKPKPKPAFRRLDDAEDPDITPRMPSLIQQFCQPASRSRSGSVTMRPLNENIGRIELKDEDGDDEMDVEKKPKVPRDRHDAALHALADACASMGLDEPDHSSPSDRLSNPPSKRHGNKLGADIQKLGARKTTKPIPSVAHRLKRSAKPYQLSPRTVYRLSQRPRVDMRIEDHPLTPNEDSDMFASYDFDRGVRGFKDGASGV